MYTVLEKDEAGWFAPTTLDNILMTRAEARKFLKMRRAMRRAIGQYKDTHMRVVKVLNEKGKELKVA